MDKPLRNLMMVMLVALLLLARPAHAYLDATSGSLLLQLLLGGVAGLAVILRLFWHRLSAPFRRRSQPEQQPGQDQHQGEQQG